MWPTVKKLPNHSALARINVCFSLQSEQVANEAMATERHSTLRAWKV
jgi:hypothetical protein